MTTMAVFQALIHCYSGSNDFVIGIDVANRIPAETEDIIGFFVNLLAIRTDLSGDPAFHELIGRVRATCLEAYSHQQLPFERIVEDLNPERQGDRIPLVQVNFGLLPAAPIKELNLEGLKLTPLGGHNATSVFEFNLYLLDSPDGLIGSLQYSSDLFERATVVRMVSSFQQIVRQVVTRPEVKLSALHSMVDDFERTQRASSAQALKKSRLRVLEAASRKGGAVQDLIEVAASPES
jgi:non-ribosomal peptide synthetase component F